MKIGFCGNEETHEPHDVYYGWSGPINYVHSSYHCRGVDEEGNVNTEERTSFHDCEE